MSKMVVAFLLVFFSGLIATLAIGPSIGVYLYELVYFLNPKFRWWGASVPSISYSFIITLATLLMFLFQRSKHQDNVLSKVPETKWLLFLLIVYCGVTFVAVHQELHKKFLVDLIKLYVMAYIFFRVLDTKNKLLIALFVYIVGCAYIGFEALSVGRNSEGRVEGIGTVDAPEANGTAALLVPSIPLLIYFAWRGNWKIKCAAAVLGIVIANGLVLINSRGAFLGAVAGATYFLSYMMFSRYKLPWQRFMVCIVIIGSIGATLRLTDDAFWERMGTIQTTATKDSEASGGRRINYWLATFDMIEDHPFGVGIFGYQVLSRFYLTEELMADRKVQQTKAVHSMWFQGLSEVGWLGSAVFLIFLFRLMLKLRKTKLLLIATNSIENYYLVLSIQAGLIGFLIAGTFIDAFRAVVLYWFFAYSLCAVAIFGPSQKK